MTQVVVSEVPFLLLYAVQWTVQYFVVYIKQQLNLASPVILTMTYGSCEKLHSVSLRLRTLKVDAQSNKERKQDVDGVYLPSRIKHNKYMKGVLTFAIVHVDVPTGCIFKCMHLLIQSIGKQYSLKNCFPDILRYTRKWRSGDAVSCARASR